ncbi:MAG: cobyric acid synthase [Lachnospiraceae bacterium]|nr:cobyric acid synthase [Lachnospiraceae bacterium]
MNLKTDNLTIGYDRDIVGNICIEAVPGRIVTLIGPNGCGKSTLLKTVTGQLKKRGGVIFLDGKDMGRIDGVKVARHMSMVMTSAVRPELMTCLEVISMGRYPYTGMLGILSDEDKRIVEDTITMTGTQDLRDRQFMSISDGQKQRVMLARAICQEPDVLILDEPTSYLDIKYKLDILTRIKKLVEDRGIAVVMSLHELDIAMKISDYVVAMGEGRILRQGTPGEVFEEGFIRRLYGIEGESLDLFGCVPWIEAKDRELYNNAYYEMGDDICKEKAVDKDIRDRHKAAAIMIQGTMSSVGKSLITAGLCRIFADDGYRVAPFKSQNMALNSYITKDGGEMGRAQVVQAECARTEPDVDMNPVLLKPNDDRTSQVIVRGRVVGNMKAAEYFEYKKELKPIIKEAYDRLAEANDIIVIEGAGSPVELNLKDNDIVNMGVAGLVDASVLLVGDIDRGGVFAQLQGTLDLLEPSERDRVKGLIVNKFRGDPALFEKGINILEEKTGTRVLGLVPYMKLNIDDEDSLSDKLNNKHYAIGYAPDIAVIRFPHISNYTDFDVFSQPPLRSVRYVDRVDELCKPDMLILPGTKNTLSDLDWFRETGLFDRVKELAGHGTVVMGICGGYQMLGRSIIDGADSRDVVTGLGLLPVDTVMEDEKTTIRYKGEITGATGILKELVGTSVEGYEIHMGRTSPCSDLHEFTSDKLSPNDNLCEITSGECVPDEDLCEFTSGGTGYCRDNVYGTYIHGLFDSADFLAGLISMVSKATGSDYVLNIDEIISRSEYKEQQYVKLAQELRTSLDMDAIYSLLNEKTV